MGLFGNQNLLFYSRVVQSVFAIAILVVFAWCSTHVGDWASVVGAAALGSKFFYHSFHSFGGIVFINSFTVIASTFSLLLGVYGIWTHWERSGGHNNRVYNSLQILFDIVVLLMWLAVAIWMVRFIQVDPKTNTIPNGPTAPWTVGIAFTFVEMYVVR